MGKDKIKKGGWQSQNQRKRKVHHQKEEVRASDANVIALLSKVAASREK